MRRNFLGAIGMSLAVAAMAFAPHSANADWSDNFDSYANGTFMNGVGGWSGWDNTPAASGTISNAQAHSGANSMLATPVSSDAVHPFTGEFTSGQVQLTAWMFIEDIGGTDTTFFIVNNQYSPPAFSWTSQLEFNMGTDLVTAAAEGGAGTAPIVYNAWSEIRILYDLGANTQQTFYNGSLMSTGVVDSTAPQAFEIANIDLYNPATANVYYDDLSVTAIPEPGTLAGLLAGLVGAAMFRRRK